MPRVAASAAALALLAGTRCVAFMQPTSLLRQSTCDGPASCLDPVMFRCRSGGGNGKMSLFASSSLKGRAESSDASAGKRKSSSKGPLDNWRRNTIRAFALTLAKARRTARSRKVRGPVRFFMTLFITWAISSFVLGKMTAGVAANAPAAASEVAYSVFLEKLGQKSVEEVVVSSARYDFVVGGEKFFTVPVAVGSEVMDMMMRAGASVRAAPRPAMSAFQALLWVVLLGYLAAIFGTMRQAFRGGGGGNIGRRARSGVTSDAVNFDMVAGIGEARREVEELKDLFQNNTKYAKLGARVPKGILLVGPPGTGKTMLAKALATECKVPFLYCSGSDFVEIFSGRGAARVRQLFARASRSAPCIVFIDELDAVGKARREGIAAASGFSNDEVEQTLNQLLTAMDGIDSTKGIVVLGATNRLSVLDQALVRPGRFDRIVQIPTPDAKGRSEILAVHARDKPFDSDIDIDVIAAATPGLVGADLAAICNEAAIRAIRDGRETISKVDIYEAVESYFKTRAAKRPSIIPGLF